MVLNSRKIEFNYMKLRGKIVAEYGTIRNFSNAFGISFNSFSRKLNNKTFFSTEDILKICEMLKIPKEEIGVYFFTLKV